MTKAELIRILEPAVTRRSGKTVAESIALLEASSLAELQQMLERQLRAGLIQRPEPLPPPQQLEDANADDLAKAQQELADVQEENMRRVGEIRAEQLLHQLRMHEAVALEKLGDRLAFKSAIQVELEQVVSKLNDQERRVAYNWFKRQRLVSDGDHGSENVTNIIGWLQRNNHPITDQTLNLALTNIVNRGTRPLRWKSAPLQDSEKEQQRQREASSAPIRQERAEAVPAHPELALAPHLKAHQEMLHRPSEAVKVTRQDSDAEWRVRAESITTDSHLDRAQLAKLFVMQQSNPTEIDWQGTHRARLLFLEKRNHARTHAGR